MGKVKGIMMELQELKMTVTCPVCEGEGLESVEVFKPQSSSRDIGEPYEELWHCETCDGSGEIEMEEEDEQEV